MIIVDDIVVNPTEAPMTPARTEVSLSEVGLSVIGADWGESAIEGTVQRSERGQVMASRKGKPRTITLVLAVRDEGEVDLPTAAHNFQKIVGELQRRETWIRRDPLLEEHAGPILFRVSGEVGVRDFLGWQIGDNPDVTLTMVTDFAGYSTEEREQGPFESAPGARDLVFTEEPGSGTVDGLWRCRATNNGAEDWRGLIISRECRYAPEDLEDPTAQLHYLASELTVKGGAQVSASPPEVRAVGALSTALGAVTPALPVGTTPGDLLIMVAESGGATEGAEANTALTAEGWSSPPAPYAAQKKGNTRLTLLYRIATGSDPRTTNDTGDHQAAKIIAIKVGTFDSLNPFNTAAVGTQNATKAVSIPGATTTRDQCLILACASGNLPDTSTTTEFGAATNASLSGITERIDNSFTAGDGGALFAVSGVKATKGAYGATTLTAVTEAERGVISVAINPLPYVQHTALTAGWITILSSEIAGVGHMTHRGPRPMWMRIEDPGSEAGGVQLHLLVRALGASRWDESLPIVSTPVVDGWIPVFLGIARPEEAVLGDERWEWRLMARAPGSSGAIRVRDVYPLSSEQYCVLSEPYQAPLADLQSSRSPGTVEDKAGVGTKAWENPSNAKASDNAYATCELGSGVVSHYLTATNLAFALPEGATVLGIVPSFERSAAVVAGNARVRDEQVRIVKAGAIKGTVDKALPVYWPQSDGAQSYGGSDDLWGQTWTPSDINSSGFGVALSAKDYEGTAIAKVDAVTVTVYYSEVIQGEDRVCYASRSVEPRSDGVFRQHPTADVWGRLVPDGFLPTVPAEGAEGRQTRTILIPSAGDLGTLPDGASPAFSAVSYGRHGYQYAREAA